MAMTGGTSKLVHTGYGQYGNTNFPIKVYVYYKTSTDASTFKSTITCGMYVTTPSGWDIGSWYDSGGSYVGTTSLTFDGEIPNFDGTRWLVENKSFTVNHNTTSGEATATIYWKWGVNSPWGQCVYPQGSFTITLPKIITACSAPTTFTATSDVSGKPFETKVALDWSGAKSGTANTISKYEIQYRVYANSAWGSWTALGSTTSTSSNVNMSSKVNRGEYVQFRIRTQGSAGSSYYSGWKTSSNIQRQPYTQCQAPTSFTITPDVFEDTVTFTWSGANAGSNNSIKGYYIQYATSSNKSTWGDWTKLTTIDLTTKNGSKAINISSKVSRGHYVKFRIRTLGNAGSDYYSDYKTSSPDSIQRQPYTQCGLPSTFTATDINSSSTSKFEITLSWSGASNGTANTISSYYIWYATSSNNSTWGSWQDLTSVSSTSVSGTKSLDITANVDRGKYVKFRIQVRGSAGSNFYSGYKETSSIRRNPYTNCSAPTTITISSDVSGQPFENNITIAWSGASSGVSNSIKSYLIRYATSSDNSNWSSYADLTTVSLTTTSGSQTINVSSKVTRKHYIKVAIKTIGTINGYDSGYTYSTTLQRNPYSACGQPTSVTVKSELDINNTQHTDVFNNQITISWSGASGGENNPIQQYYIQYCTSTNKSSWNSWSSLQSSNLTPVGTSSTTVDISDKINRGSYIKFRIRTEGEAGISYVSPYIETNPIQRKDIPTVVNLTVSAPNTLEYSYGDSIILNWNQNTEVTKYLNAYEVSVRYTESDTWLDWQILDANVSNVATAYTFNQNNDIYQAIANNKQVQFRIRVQDIFGEYSTSYSDSAIISRYDDSGMCIAINGKWIPCQLYFGEGGQWVEKSMGVGLNNNWSQCGVE